MKKLLLLIALIFVTSAYKPKEITWVAIGDSITYLNEHPNETGNRITKGYMTRVVEKLPNIHYINQGHNGWTSGGIADKIETFDDVKQYCHHYYKTEDKLQYNAIINSLKICDPAVGSGHFLVSALNEIIAIKNELGILIDKNGLSLKVDIEIINDELFVNDQDGNPYQYNPKNKDSQRIQETLFHEKQTIIEN